MYKVKLYSRTIGEAFRREAYTTSEKSFKYHLAAKLYSFWINVFGAGRDYEYVEYLGKGN